MRNILFLSFFLLPVVFSAKGQRVTSLVDKNLSMTVKEAFSNGIRSYTVVFINKSKEDIYMLDTVYTFDCTRRIVLKDTLYLTLSFNMRNIMNCNSIYCLRESYKLTKLKSGDTMVLNWPIMYTSKNVIVYELAVDYLIGIPSSTNMTGFKYYENPKRNEMIMQKNYW